MKKRFLLFTIFGAFAYLLFSSNAAGPANISHLNCTGSQASQRNCAGSGCHGVSGPTAVGLYLYAATSSATTVDTILPNQPYTLVILGTNTSLSTHDYGFQASSVSGIGAAQTQAGTWSTSFTNTLGITSLPLSNPTVDLVENQAMLVASSSLPLGTFHDTLYWTAPPTGTSSGPVTFYCTELAVNGNGQADTSDVSGNDSLTVYFNGTSSVRSISENTAINAFPNPFSSQFRLQLNHADAGTYTVRVYNLAGQTLYKQSMQINSSSFETNINTSNWAPGFYGIQVLDKDGAQRIIPLIKQ